MTIDIIQTIAIIASVLIAAVAIQLTRKQAEIAEKQSRIAEEHSRLAAQAIREAAYDGVLADYSALTRTVLESQHLRHLFGSANPDMRSRWESYTEEDKDVYLYTQALYGMFDRIYALRRRGNEWVSDSEWAGWEEWLRIAIHYPMLREVHRDSAGTVTQAYVSLVDRIIDENAATKRQEE